MRVSLAAAVLAAVIAVLLGMWFRGLQYAEPETWPDTGTHDPYLEGLI